MPSKRAVQEYWNVADARAAYEAASEAGMDSVREFERRFADLVGGLDAAFAVSGRQALFGALTLIGLEPGDGVVISAFNCTRVPDAILRRRGVPVLVDVRLPGGEIDLDEAVRVSSNGVRAALVPHLFGIPVDCRDLAERLKKDEVTVIEDCAHCLGGRIAGQMAGSVGAFSIFSFNTGKPITLGNGGMLVCSDRRFLPEFRQLKRTWREDLSSDPERELEAIEGILKSLTAIREDMAKTPSTVPVLPRKGLLQVGALRRTVAFFNRRRPDAPLSHPFNEEFSPVGAVRAQLGISLLDQWSAIESRRNENAQYLRERIGDTGLGRLYPVPSHIKPAYYQLNVYADALTPRQVRCAIAELRRAGFRAGRWPFLPEVRHLAGYMKYASSLDNMRRMATYGFHLPIHQNLSSADMDEIVDILLSVQKRGDWELCLTGLGQRLFGDASDRHGREAGPDGAG